MTLLVACSAVVACSIMATTLLLRHVHVVIWPKLSPAMAAGLGQHDITLREAFLVLSLYLMLVTVIAYRTTVQAGGYAPSEPMALPGRKAHYHRRPLFLLLFALALLLWCFPDVLLLHLRRSGATGGDFKFRGLPPGFGPPADWWNALKSFFFDIPDMKTLVTIVVALRIGWCALKFQRGVAQAEVQAVLPKRHFATVWLMVALLGVPTVAVASPLSVGFWFAPWWTR